jgi:hypothetical protein
MSWGCEAYGSMSMNELVSQDMPSPAMPPAIEAGILWLVVRAWDSRAWGYCCGAKVLSSFHQPAVLVAEKSGEHDEKGNSMAGESEGAHVVIGILSELGGVKADRALLDPADEYVRPMFCAKGSLLLDTPIAGDAWGVSW